MEINLKSKDIHIRKIEDIIDIQRANGSIDDRQVAFKLQSETESNILAKLTNSLESGLSKTKHESHIKKEKKLRLQQKSTKKMVSDAMSWPSDSDITVLRMKMRLKSNVKSNVGSIVSGDGLHHHDSSSMTNLATLTLQSQNPSKQNVLEELLLPLTSWEEGGTKVFENEDDKIRVLNLVTNIKDNTGATTSREQKINFHESTFEECTTKSKLARFLRLYFCPCCSCLYKLEKMRAEPSACFSLPGSTRV